jgi:hypothetical protein
MKLNLLSEQRMRQIVRESIKKVIMEDEMYDYDDDEMYSDYGDEAYTWSIYIGEEEIKQLTFIYCSTAFLYYSTSLFFMFN